MSGRAGDLGRLLRLSRERRGEDGNGARGHERPAINH
jgi:hypothetical protein